MSTSFPHPQQHHQHHRGNTRAEPIDTRDGEHDSDADSTSPGDIYLFGNPAPPALTSATRASGSKDPVLYDSSPLVRTLSTGSEVSDLSSGQVLGSPTNMGSSLFPVHDGKGSFTLGDSLMLSEAPSIYASVTGDGITTEDDRGLDLADDLISNARSSRSSISAAVEVPADRVRRRSLSRAPSSSFSELSRPSDELDTAGSWQLTEQALSRASEIHSEDVVFTSDSSEDESLAGPSASSRGRRIMSRRVDRSLDDESLSNAEQEGGQLHSSFISKGLPIPNSARSDSSQSRDSYPTPPPDFARRPRHAVKRRHRTSGRVEGSQKKSSTSGSVGDRREALSSDLVNINLRGRREEPGDVVMRGEREWITKRVAEKKVFLGRFVSRLGNMQETLQLIADDTPSRSVTPTPAPFAIAHESPDVHYSRIGGHGWEYFARSAREDLGDFHFRGMTSAVNAEMYDVDEETGDETETEGVVHGRQEQHVDSSSGTTHRSLSLTSLPLYLLSALPSLGSSATTSAGSNFDHDEAIRLRPTVRRTLSFSSGEKPGRALGARDEVVDDSALSVNDLESTLGYWRRVFRMITQGY